MIHIFPLFPSKARKWLLICSTKYAQNDINIVDRNKVNARLRDEKLSAYAKTGILMKNERDMKELNATADKKPSERHEKLMFFRSARLASNKR